LPFEAAVAQRIGVPVDNLRDRLGAAAFASAVRRGTTFSDGEIIDFARAQIYALPMLKSLDRRVASIAAFAAIVIYGLIVKINPPPEESFPLTRLVVSS
jgi:hypothetical protein